MKSISKFFLGFALFLLLSSSPLGVSAANPEGLVQVQYGDMFESLSERYGTTVEALIAYNQLPGARKCSAVCDDFGSFVSLSDMSRSTIQCK